MSKDVKTGKKADKKAMQEKAQRDFQNKYPASKKKIKDSGQTFNSTISF